MYKKTVNRIKSIKGITKTDMLAFLKVSNLILITTAIMLCISLIMSKEHKWEYVNETAALLWMNLMFLIMSGAYYFYFLFQFKGENWINFKEDTVFNEAVEHFSTTSDCCVAKYIGETKICSKCKMPELVDKRAYPEDEIEEFMKIGNPNIPTPDSSPNEDDANNPQITRMNEQLDELLGPKDIPLTIINNQQQHKVLKKMKNTQIYCNKENLLNFIFADDPNRDFSIYGNLDVVKKLMRKKRIRKIIPEHLLIDVVNELFDGNESTITVRELLNEYVSELDEKQIPTLLCVWFDATYDEERVMNDTESMTYIDNIVLVNEQEISVLDKVMKVKLN